MCKKFFKGFAIKATQVEKGNVFMLNMHFGKTLIFILNYAYSSRSSHRKVESIKYESQLQDQKFLIGKRHPIHPRPDVFTTNARLETKRKVISSFQYNPKFID